MNTRTDARTAHLVYLLALGSFSTTPLHFFLEQSIKLLPETSFTGRRYKAYTKEIPDASGICTAICFEDSEQLHA